MNRSLRVVLVAAGMVVATPSIAAPANANHACTIAGGLAGQDAALLFGTPNKASAGLTSDNPSCASAGHISGIEMALCLMLLGSVALTGSQAARRKAIKVVAS